VIKERNGDCAVFHAKIFISQGCEEPQGYLSREYGNVLSALRAFSQSKSLIICASFERLIDTSINE
jgi:hypothetical protein